MIKILIAILKLDNYSVSELPWLNLVNYVGHIIFLILPILWLFGILPPIDAYVLWIAEQWNVIALGKFTFV